MLGSMAKLRTSRSNSDRMIAETHRPHLRSKVWNTSAASIPSVRFMHLVGEQHALKSGQNVVCHCRKSLPMEQ